MTKARANVDPNTNKNKAKSSVSTEDDFLNLPVHRYDFSSLETKLMTLALWLLVFVVYYTTLFPSAPGGDSAELIISAHQMSIAHPPGYPLFTWLGKLFIKLLPFGTIAWRVNLMSAMCGVFSSVLLFRSVALWTGNNWAGFLASTMFTFTPLIWTYTVQAEVFSLNNMFVNLMIYLSVLYAYSKSAINKAGPSGKPTYNSITLAHLGAFFAGLAMTNQHTIVVFLIPIIFWVTIVLGRNELLFDSRRWVSLFLALFAGLIPYVHLVISPMVNPHKYSWGDTSSFRGFFKHFLREEYGTLQLYSGHNADNSGLMDRWILYFGNAHRELLYIGLPLAFIGMYASIKGKRLNLRSVGFLFGVAYLFYITVFFSLTNLPLTSALHVGVLMRFFMQPNAMLCVWLGVGFAYVSDKLLPVDMSEKQRKNILGLIVILLSAIQISKNYSTQDQSQNWYFYYYGRGVLEPLPPNALLLVGGDLQSNIPQYVQLCEGFRTDVDVLPIETMSWDWWNSRQGIFFPNVTLPGYVYHPWKKGAYSMKDFLDANVKVRGRETFIAGEWKFGDPTHTDHYMTVPFGFSSRVFPKDYQLDVWDWLPKLNKALPVASEFPLPNDTVKYNAESWEHVVLSNFWEAYTRKANLFLTIGFDAKRPDSERAMEIVIETLEYVRVHYPTKWTLKYLGAAYDHLRYRQGHKQKEHLENMVRVWSEFLALGDDGNDKEYKIIVDAVEASKQQLKTLA
eukprot:TRINITY_DN5020_c0_g1_i1.p1 TRINITY_DN5020_c0_g1~~TRINITY_DN5020_c0_g1_i1.p1  ORF type:complete len:735 (-),score=119.08 TRINITY_DN5020_c0_g1_i1:49-2253(-)